jgi:hypothetical protein
VRSAFLLQAVRRKSAVERLRDRFGRRGRQTQTRVPTYREASP